MIDQALSKIPHSVPIERLSEIEGDWIGATLAYFARGHFDVQSFIDAVTSEWEPSAPIDVSQVRHSYYCQNPIEGAVDWWTFDRCKKDTPGAIAVTIVEVG